MGYTLGLDIGIASIGWALLDMERQRIVDLGVRIFAAAEAPDTGAPLAQPRRLARSLRRRLRHKRSRLNDLRLFLVEKGVLTREAMKDLFDRPAELSPWELRAQGLDRLLEPEEWARVLYHMTAHRGFKSNRKEALSDGSGKTETSEDKKAKAAMQANEELRLSGEYRTVGEMVARDAKFDGHKRNKAGDYSHSLSRGVIGQEIAELFKAQRALGNPHTSVELEEAFRKIFERQEPFASRKEIEKLVGYCTLMPTCKRAPRAAWTSERFKLLNRVTTLKISGEKGPVALTVDQQKIIVTLAYKQTKVTFAQLRKALGAPDDWRFGTLHYWIDSKKTKNQNNLVEPVDFKNTVNFEESSAQQEQEIVKQTEKQTFVELKAFHQFRKVITDRLGQEAWDRLLETPQILDTMAKELTLCKTEQEAASHLRDCQIPGDLIDAVLPLSFSGVMHLSIEAMQALIPHMEQGLDYVSACGKAELSPHGPEHAAGQLLEPLLPEEVRNPVVFRALSQVRKVVNAIIRKYGSPSAINIELARDLAKSYELRREIEKKQLDNRTYRQNLKNQFLENFGHEPSGLELEKYAHWREQSEHCAYSGAYIIPERAFLGDDRGTYTEIDHILPYSRSFDNRRINKVLVLTEQNRNKGNRTPYEWFGADEVRWGQFQANVKSYIRDQKQREILFKKDFSEREAGEWKERSLTDTRYITSFVALWLEESLRFDNATNEKKQRVRRLNGGATAYLRTRWGLSKKRDESHLHHALDACVIAATTQRMVGRIAEYSKIKETPYYRHNGDKPHFPAPWPNFRAEVEARLSDNPAEALAGLDRLAYTPEELGAVKPVLVSHQPRRKATGSAHDDTIYGICERDGQEFLVSSISLQELNLNKLEQSLAQKDDRRLYEKLKKCLEETGGEAKKAFPVGVPFYKPQRDGTDGPLVRKIKIFNSVGARRVEARGGLVKGGTQVRVDVYTKNNKYYLIPYFSSDIAARRVKNRAILADKQEEDWTIIDGTYEFCFSLFKNDYVRVVLKKGKEIRGYYLGVNISNGAISVLDHKTPRQGKKSKEDITLKQQKRAPDIYSSGVKMAELLEKYVVTPLGDLHRVTRERPPHELA